MLQVKDISKSYADVKALSDISFTLNQGSIVGLLGVNGAGKSTLMKILVGILEPDSGQIIFQNRDFFEHLKKIQGLIGYLSEENPLYDDMYVLEYLSYVAGLYKEDKSRVSLVIEQTGLESEYKKKIGTLSKGNKQRVGIAQALIHDPLFLILDESTSGLDPNQRESITKLLVDLSSDKIILYSTHILHEVKEICSRFILIDKGVIVADQDVNNINSIEDTFYLLTHENSSR